MARRKSAAETETPNFLSRLPVAAQPSKPGPRGKEQPKVEVAGLEVYGAFHRVTKEIEDGFLPLYKTPITDSMFSHFIEEGVRLGRCPVNYKGTEGLVGDASLQLRRKDSRSKLAPEIVQRFQEHNIRLHHDVQAPNTLRVRPEVFSANQTLMNKMLECLKNNGFDIDEIFEVQEERSDWIVGEHTLDDLFARAKEAKEAREKNPRSNAFTDVEIRELLELCASATISPKWEGTFDEAFSIVRNIVSPVPVPEAPETDKKRKVA